MPRRKPDKQLKYTDFNTGETIILDLTAVPNGEDYWVKKNGNNSKVLPRATATEILEGMMFYLKRRNRKRKIKRS